MGDTHSYCFFFCIHKTGAKIVIAYTYKISEKYNKSVDKVLATSMKVFLYLGMLQSIKSTYYNLTASVISIVFDLPL